MQVKTLVVLILVFLGVIAFSFSPWLVTVSEVVCRSQYGRCGLSVEEKLATVRNVKLAVARKEVKTVIVKDLTVEDYSCRYLFPNKLRVDVIEKKAKFALKTSGEDKYFLVDRGGLVIKVERTSNLPFVEVSNLNYNLGDFVSENNLFFLEMIYGLFGTYQVRSGVVKDDSLEIVLNNGLGVIFPGDGDKEVLLGSLDYILGKIENEESGIKSVMGNPVRLIDLRYQNPVLR